MPCCDHVLTVCASSNMLYPREDKETDQLIFQCRNCQWPTAVGPTCIYRNEVMGNLIETAGVVTDVASDPTVRYCYALVHLIHAYLIVAAPC
jgi:DNA-directed RNA polymerase subunit M/transcription elongation factor TFIIS